MLLKRRGYFFSRCRVRSHDFRARANAGRIEQAIKLVRNAVSRRRNSHDQQGCGGSYCEANREHAPWHGPTSRETLLDADARPLRERCDLLLKGRRSETPPLHTERPKLFHELNRVAGIASMGLDRLSHTSKHCCDFFL